VFLYSVPENLKNEGWWKELRKNVFSQKLQPKISASPLDSAPTFNFRTEISMEEQGLNGQV